MDNTIYAAHHYGINKQRFGIMKRIVGSHYRKIKIMLVLPVIAFISCAFSGPECNSDIFSESGMNPARVSEAIQKEARGIVINEEGMPLQGVTVIATKSIIRTTTNATGRFAISRIPDGSALIFSCKGYKTYTLPPLFTSNSTLRIRLVKDPEYKAPVIHKSDSLVVKDSIIS